MALNLTLRKSFLYIFATVGLVLCIIAGVSFINLGLKTYVLKKADNYCYNYASPMSIDKDGKEVQRTQAQLDQDKKNCEEQRSSQRQSQAANAIAMLLVGIPLYTYHWYRIRSENQI
ncbi:MAG: hypothetical protein KW802_03995 [Candidatus Doudnabacteria bacterium]|nr:hypothetical protein [Candidatus Doudnabacteria bacterium]